MSEYWDEMFLDLHNQKVLAEQLESISEDNSWMNWTIEECMAGIQAGQLVGKDDQKWTITFRQALDGRVRVPIPEDLTTGIGESPKPDETTYMNRKNGELLGFRQLDRILDQEQIEQFGIQMVEQIRLNRPDVQVYETKTMVLKGVPVFCYEALIMIESVPYVQITCIHVRQGMVTMSSSQFQLENAAYWQPLTYAILASIEWS